LVTRVLLDFTLFPATFSVVIVVLLGCFLLLQDAEFEE
jgi:hypothetical protein